MGRLRRSNGKRQGAEYGCAQPAGSGGFRPQAQRAVAEAGEIPLHSAMPGASRQPSESRQRKQPPSALFTGARRKAQRTRQAATAQRERTAEQTLGFRRCAWYSLAHGTTHHGCGRGAREKGLYRT